MIFVYIEFLRETPIEKIILSFTIFLSLNKWKNNMVFWKYWKYNFLLKFLAQFIERRVDRSIKIFTVLFYYISLIYFTVFRGICISVNLNKMYFS